MYVTSGAAIGGESDLKGTISADRYADLAILSADYLAVEDEDISRIESLLTIVGGKIGYPVADYEGLARPLPPILRTGTQCCTTAGITSARPESARHNG
jgi:Amidohydrolase family